MLNLAYCSVVTGKVIDQNREDKIPNSRNSGKLGHNITSLYYLYHFSRYFSIAKANYLKCKSSDNLDILLIFCLLLRSVLLYIDNRFMTMTQSRKQNELHWWVKLYMELDTKKNYQPGDVVTLQSLLWLRCWSPWLSFWSPIGTPHWLDVMMNEEDGCSYTTESVLNSCTRKF